MLLAGHKIIREAEKYANNTEQFYNCTLQQYKIRAKNAFVKGIEFAELKFLPMLIDYGKWYNNIGKDMQKHRELTDQELIQSFLTTYHEKQSQFQVQ